MKEQIKRMMMVLATVCIASTMWAETTWLLVTDDGRVISMDFVALIEKVPDSETIQVKDVYGEVLADDIRKVTFVILGDADGSGTVDHLDVTAIVNRIMGQPSKNFNEKAADTNLDGTVDISDVVRLINQLTGNE